MQFDVRQAVAGALTIGMFLALLEMMISGPSVSSHQEINVSVVTTGDNVVGQLDEKGSVTITVSDKTPKYLWGLPGPILQPCWSKHIASKHKKTRGYVLLKLSTSPLYHPMQVADAVIVARSLGAILVLPSGGFNKVYDVDKFISSLNGVVQVVAQLPAELRTAKPEIVKVPYKVTPEYISEKVRPLFSEKHVIQITSVLSKSSQSVKDSSTEEMQALRCLVTYSALQFHSKVKKLGDQVVSSLREMSGSGRFIAVDLRVDMLSQTGCMQPENSKSKRCFDASNVAAFLKRVGFLSDVPIYLTQSRWDPSLDVLKDTFPRIYTKDQLPALSEGHHPQLEKALDLYICTHSDVFVPAISGLAYVNIAGNRIATGRTQILVPTVSDEGSLSKLQLARVVSRFVTKKDHAVYSCFCKPSSSSSELEEKDSTT